MNILIYLQNISWREPLWLLLAIYPFVIIAIRKFIQKKKSTQYADIELYPWVNVPAKKIATNSLVSKNSIYLLAWLLFSIAIAGPRWPISYQNNEKIFGADIMLVVDHSKSMKARDILPSRIRRARLEIYELLEKAANHRIGITVFSARPHLFVPLTFDHNALKKYLKSFEELTFPTEGSNPFDAIQFASKELSRSNNPSVIILMTDGDFSSFTDKQKQSITQSNIPIFVLGLGTIEGEAIQSIKGDWLRYNDKHVISKMNEPALINLARMSKGKYSPVYDDSSDWESIYDQGILNLNSITKIKGNSRILWHELFPYFLVPSLLLFIISLNTIKLTRESFSKLALVILCIFLYPENNVHAFELGQTTEQSAYRLYQDKKYEYAIERYKKIKGFSGHIGHANSLYKQGHFYKAIKYFSIAVISAQNDNQRIIALYNLANSYFRTGQFSLAISTYKDVLRYQPSHKASLYNIKTSQILKKNIELRIKKQEQSIRSSRQGRGPKSASIADGSEIGENTSVSVGESNKLLDKKIPLPKLPDLDDNTVKKLLLAGLKSIKLANNTNSSDQNNSFKLNNSLTSLKDQQQLNAIDDRQHLLWKRLFEMEEGFPAPVDTPRQIPGIEPW